MGLIKSIFGAIFGLISGIFKLVGLGKKSEYFMEASDSDGDAPAAIAPSAPAPAPQAKAAPAKAEAKAKAKPAPKAAPTPAPAAAAVAAEPAPTGFASNYLTSVGTTMPRRRRPGPSMSPFMTMAKQVTAR